MKRQRTRLQAYKHVLAMFKAKRLGAYSSKDRSCAYRLDERRCAVGCFFTEAQLDDITERRLNIKAGVSQLAAIIGQKNIEHVTGLTLKELIDLQSYHDSEAANDWNKSGIRDGLKTSRFYKFVTEKIQNLSGSYR